MALEKRSKSLLLFILILFLLTGLIIGGIVYYQYQSVQYNAELDELEWPDGAILIKIRMQTPDTAKKVSKDVEVIPLDQKSELKLGNYVYSSDGQIKTYFSKTKYNAQEFLSPTKILFSGILADSEPVVEEKTKLYFLTPEKIYPISLPEGFEKKYLIDMSLSPSQDYLEYRLSGQDYEESEICISTFNLEELGECVDLKKLIPEEYSNKKEYYIRGDWMKEEDIYVLQVRSNKKHHFEPGIGEDAPDQRVQDEMARYFYYPDTQTVEEVSLDEKINLKTPDIFLDEKDRKLLKIFDTAYFKGEYKFIHNIYDNSLGIQEKSTGKKAKLIDAFYYGDGMPGFDSFLFNDARHGVK